MLALMAVRAFDITDVSKAPLSVVERLAHPRRDARRLRQRYAIAGIAAVTVPFLTALVVLGVGH